MDGTTLIAVAIVLLLIVVVASVVASRSRRKEEGSETEVPARPMTAGLGDRLRRALGSDLDASTWERLEEALVAADVGVEPSSRIVDHVRSARPGSVDEARSLLRTGLRSQFLDVDRALRLEGEPAVALIVGVNGSGKTTTIAKLAHRLTGEGRTVVLGAADTFRAGAGEQLDEWAKRVGVDAVMGQQGGDPASVAFDTIASAKAKGADVVIVDTAGRLHGKKNLMEELAKVHRVAASAADVTEVLLVLDATSGQNGLAQVSQFVEAVPLTGIVLAKLDGTARGGIVVAVESRLALPVKLVGLGEGPDDLETFDPDRFVESLLEDR